MKNQIEGKCESHPHKIDCPDFVVMKYNKGYGLPIRDGGSSFIIIKFCPWCGKNLKEQNGSHRIRSKKST